MMIMYAINIQWIRFNAFLIDLWTLQNKCISKVFEGNQLNELDEKA